MSDASPLPSVRLHQLSKHFGETRVLDTLSFSTDDPFRVRPEQSRGVVREFRGSSEPSSSVASSTDFAQLPVRDFRAFRGPSDAPPAPFIAIIGPSGCGKSTLLRLLAGLDSPTSGEISIDGAPPHCGAENVSFVFQEPTLLPWLTAAANVEVPLALRGTPSRERHALAAASLASVGLADKASLLPSQLSGGQKMRVSLARALVNRPRLLLLDEPFGALDEMTRNRLNEDLLAWRAREPWTAFFVTHSVSEAVFLATRVLVLAANPGRIHKSITIDLPYPRTAALRAHPDYLTLVARVTEALQSTEDAS